MLGTIIRKLFGMLVQKEASRVSYLTFLHSLPMEERPYYDTSVAGFVISSRPDLGVFKKSDGDALDALAAERGFTLYDNA